MALYWGVTPLPMPDLADRDQACRASTNGAAPAT